MSTDNREDVLLRPEPTFAPYSVYVDVSPTYVISSEEAITFEEGPGYYVSETFRVWQLENDCHNIATAKRYKLATEMLGGVAKVYDNSLELFISDHPVFFGK